MTGHLDLRNPITTLAQLNEITLELDQVQSWVDHARFAAPTNQRVQLNLDREQTEIDRKRELIELAMIDIASRN
jgi:hypothetical protein